jgi:short-subunit dehydrogenase
MGASRGVAVVTGGAGGLGTALTSTLDRAGYEVVPVDLKGTSTRLDVTDAAACRALAEELQPSLWVNNAGLTGAGSLMERSDAEVEALVSVNLIGVIHGTRAALSTMLPRGRGRVLNIASLAGWGPVPHIAVYSATKNAVRAFSVAADSEIESSKVRVQCLLPNGIATPMVDVTDPRHLMSFTGKRLLDPDEVASAALALLDSRRAVASVPHSRGALVRTLAVFPSLGRVMKGLIERQARSNQQKAIAEARSRSNTTHKLADHG